MTNTVRLPMGTTMSPILRLVRPEPERDPQDVIEDHLRLRVHGEVERDLERNYAPDVVVLTSWGAFHGHTGCRSLAAKIKSELPDGRFEFIRVVIRGGMGFVNWRGMNSATQICNGADSFVVERGRIVAQTSHYEVVKRQRESRTPLAVPPK